MDQIPCTLNGALYLFFDNGALNCVQEREMEDSRRILCGFCSPGSLKAPICADERKIARTPGGVLSVSGTAVVIRRNAEQQMRTATFFLIGISSTS